MPVGCENLLAQSELPDSARTKLLVWTTAFFVFFGLSRYLLERLDWQILRGRACRECLRANRIAENLAQVFDAGAGSSLFYLLILPFLAAADEEKYPPAVLASIGLLVFAICILLVATGYLFRKFGVRWASRHKPSLPASGTRSLKTSHVSVPFPGTKSENARIWSIAPRDAERVDACFLTGVRMIGFALGVLLCVHGPSQEAVATTLDSVLGAELSGRLLAAVGVGAIRDPALIVLSCVSISSGLRWGVPFLLGSRPAGLAKGTSTGAM